MEATSKDSCHCLHACCQEQATHSYHSLAQFRSVTQSCLTLCDPMDCSTPGLPVPHHLLEFAQVHVHCLSDAIQPSHPLLPSSPSALNLSQHQGLCLQHMTKILELQLQCQSSSEYSGLISLEIDWFDLLAVQGTLKSLLQNHSLKAFYGSTLTSIHT